VDMLSTVKVRIPGFTTQVAHGNDPQGETRIQTLSTVAGVSDLPAVTRRKTHHGSDVRMQQETYRCERIEPNPGEIINLAADPASADRNHLCFWPQLALLGVLRRQFWRLCRSRLCTQLLNLVDTTGVRRFGESEEDEEEGRDA
jgi:hypothetical protein